LVAVAGLGIWSGDARAQTYNAISGRPLRILNAYSTNPDCSSIGQAVVRMTQAPQHGHVIIRSASIYPNFPASNPRSACNARRVPGVEAVYVSERGYLGFDSASFDIIYASGSYRQYTPTINVR